MQNVFQNGVGQKICTTCEKIYFALVEYESFFLFLALNSKKSAICVQEIQLTRRSVCCVTLGY